LPELKVKLLASEASHQATTFEIKPSSVLICGVMVQLMTAPPDGVWVDNGGWSWLVDGVVGVYVGLDAASAC